MPGTTDKTPVLALIHYETREVRSRVIPTVDGATLVEAIAEHVDGSRTELWTDSAKPGIAAGKTMRSHQSVDHATGEYVRKTPTGRVTIDMCEGFFSQLKWSIDGTHHHVSTTHLQRYLDQFDFMYSLCKQTDSARMHKLIGRAGDAGSPTSRLPAGKIDGGPDGSCTRWGGFQGAPGDCTPALSSSPAQRVTARQTGLPSPRRSSVKALAAGA